MIGWDHGPVHDLQGRPADQIRLTGLTVRGFHGVFDHERRAGQDFAVDVVLHLDTRPAAADDDLTKTVHYGHLAVALADVVRGDPVDLIETLAERLAAVCLSDPKVIAADVAVHKPSAPITEQFSDVVVAIRRYRSDPVADDVLDARPSRPAQAVLALGANLGDRTATLRAAVAELAELPDRADDRAGDRAVRVIAVSEVVQTAPVGGPEQPDYLNAVVLVQTSLSPLELLDACRAIEARHGRVRDIRWGARTLDIDLIAYDQLVASSERLTLPHPRAWQRAFVLGPWHDVDPGAVLPGAGGGQAVADLLARAGDRDALRRTGIRLDGGQ